jgi:hypothetical protein
MPLTRANLESFLVSRVGGKLAFVGRSQVTNGTNPDLNDAIVDAVLLLGGSVTDYSDVSDLDVQTVLSFRTFVLQSRFSALRGLCELFALRAIWGWFLDIDESAGGRTQSWATMSQEIVTRIAALEALYASLLKVYAPIVPGTYRNRNTRPPGPEF